MDYIELEATSHFSFVRGASSCEELFATASLDMPALAIVDRNSFTGHVRAHEATKVIRSFEFHPSPTTGQTRDERPLRTPFKSGGGIDRVNFKIGSQPILM